MSETPAARPPRWNFNTVWGLVAIAFGVALFAITPGQVERPLLLFGQKPSGLDPDFFPRLVAVLFVLFGGWLVWRSFALVETNGLRLLDREAIVNVAVTVLMFFAFAVALPRVGFVIAAVVVIAVLSTFYGNRNVWAGAAISIGVPLAFFNIMRVWLKVVLPGQPFFPNVLWF